MSLFKKPNGPERFKKEVKDQTIEEEK